MEIKKKIRIEKQVGLFTVLLFGLNEQDKSLDIGGLCWGFISLAGSDPYINPDVGAETQREERQYKTQKEERQYKTQKMGTATRNAEFIVTEALDSCTAGLALFLLGQLDKKYCTEIM